MKYAPLVSIVIANYNGEEYLYTCLKSILASSYKKFELILVDDGSTDNSLRIIGKFKKLDKRICVVRNRYNMGAAASRNEAIKKSKGEIIVFLDNDTEVTPNWLIELIKPLERENLTGASQAVLLDFNKRNSIQMAGGLLIPQTGWLIPFYQWQKYSEVKNKLKEKSIVAISAALAVKKKTIDKVGRFDEKEAIYTEDLDFCWRIWIAGYKIVLAPDSRVFHWTKSVKERSGMKASYEQIYFHLAKNSFRSIIKNYEAKNIIKYLPVSLFISLGRGFLVLVRRGNLSALAGTIHACLWNLRYIGDTLEERKIIQKGRRSSDEKVMSEMFDKGSLIDIYNRAFRKTKLLW